ncbi:MAG: DUF3098 domain-containing protein [Porphyromonadaceae bacterium]|nr:DUF3098 domain-containing protein [Porphyromonadaceae bacterium]
MSRKNFALSKTNLIICGIAVLLIIAGFLLMTGAPSSFDNGFEPDIFSTRRVKVAPVIVLSGFILMIVGILYPSKERKDDEHE